MEHFRILKHPLLQNIKKIEGKSEGGHFGDFFGKTNSHNAEKTERGPCSLAWYCMLQGKKEKPF